VISYCIAIVKSAISNSICAHSTLCSSWHYQYFPISSSGAKRRGRDLQCRYTTSCATNSSEIMYGNIQYTAVQHAMYSIVQQPFPRPSSSCTAWGMAGQRSCSLYSTVQYSTVLYCAVCVNACSRPSLAPFTVEGRQVGLGGSVEALPEARELGAVAGAVEGPVVGIPGHYAFHMRAHRCSAQSKEACILVGRSGTVLSILYYLNCTVKV